MKIIKKARHNNLIFKPHFLKFRIRIAIGLITQCEDRMGNVNHILNKIIIIPSMLNLKN